MDKPSLKVIACADVHLGDKLYNMPELEQDQRDNFVNICTIAINLQVDVLVIVGDLYENNQPKPDLIAFVKGQASRLKAKGIKVVGIAGDHDKPINRETWCQVSDIEPITSVKQFFGFDYFDYSQETDTLKNRIEQHTDNERVEWIYLHGQVPTLFKFSEDKKKLDFTNIDIFSYFPNLRGIVLGDIHNPLEGTITDKDKTAYIGYCGTTGVTDASEIPFAKTVLYFDGKKLSRVAIPCERDFVRINFIGKGVEDFDPVPYIQKYKDAEKRPIFIIDHDMDSKDSLAKVRALESVGFVKPYRRSKHIVGDTEEIINIRSELSTVARITAVLKECCKNRPVEVLDIGNSILEGCDPKAVLDEFKARSFE